MEKWVVDRIEEIYIVLEKDNEIINVKKEEFEFEVKEGDVVIINEEGKYVLDEETINFRKKEIEQLVSDLWEN